MGPLRLPRARGHRPDTDRPARPATMGGVDGRHGRFALAARAGRLGRAGDTERLALFEWATAPELDPADVAGWAQANPALGQTVTADELGHAYSMATTPDSRAEFERAHLNR